MEQFEVMVGTLQGERIKITLNKQDKTAKLTSEISKKKGIEENSFVVLLDGKWIDPTQTVTESGITSKSNLCAVISNNGLGTPIRAAIFKPFFPPKPSPRPNFPPPATPASFVPKQKPDANAPFVNPGKGGMAEFAEKKRMEQVESAEIREEFNESDVANIKMIVEMGFTENEARMAYISATRNVERAIEILLSRIL